MYLLFYSINFNIVSPHFMSVILNLNEKELFNTLNNFSTYSGSKKLEVINKCIEILNENTIPIILPFLLSLDVIEAPNILYKQIEEKILELYANINKIKNFKHKLNKITFKDEEVKVEERETNDNQENIQEKDEIDDIFNVIHSSLLKYSNKEIENIINNLFDIKYKENKTKELQIKAIESLKPVLKTFNQKYTALDNKEIPNNSNLEYKLMNNIKIISLFIDELKEEDIFTIDKDRKSGSA
ncbi:hypothetical protein SLOPH_514, partial [Spraguea lophii 42_110]